jgi:putative sigma-54 modulation protein
VEITVTGRHPGISQEMRTNAEGKVRKLTRIFDRLSSARVTLEVNGIDHCAEASVHGPRGAVFVAHASAADMATAVEQLSDRLERQLRKFKTKIGDQRLLKA